MLILKPGLLAAAGVGAALAASSAYAQAAPARDPARACASWRAQWDDVAAADDPMAMRVFLARAPSVCPRLRRQIQRHIVARTPTLQHDVYPPIERVEPGAPRRTPAPG